MKKTKKELFEEIKSIEGATDEIIDFCNAQISILDEKAKKSKRNTSKKREENLLIFKEVSALMEEGKKYTATEVANLMEEPVSTPKMTAVLKVAKAENLVTRVVEKGRGVYVKGEC